MFHRKSRKFRRRPNGRGHLSHENGHAQKRMGLNSYSNSQTRNNFRSTQSPEKLLEKYSTLAKEAMSSGDKVTCENFLQHADHFTRIIGDKNKNKDQNKSNIINKSIVEDKQPSQNNDIGQEEATKNNNDIGQEEATKNKE